MNPAAYSFTSIAMLDALKAFEGPYRAISEYPRPRRAASPLHTLERRQIGDLRPRPYGYIVAMRAATQISGKFPEALPRAVRIRPR